MSNYIPQIKSSSEHTGLRGWIEKTPLRRDLTAVAAALAVSLSVAKVGPFQTEIPSTFSCTGQQEVSGDGNTVNTLIDTFVYYPGNENLRGNKLAESQIAAAALHAQANYRKDKNFVLNVFSSNESQAVQPINSPDPLIMIPLECKQTNTSPF